MSTREALDLAKAASPEIYGKACAGCAADLDWIHFRRDSSSRDGRAALCWDCENTPRLSTQENLSRLEELNFNSEGTKRQRWEYQDEYRCDEARIGRPLHYSDFINVLGKLIPNLYFMEGRIEGHLAVFRTFPGPQTRLDGRDFEYLWYIPKIVMPEYSQYEFDNTRDILVREKVRGWRTPLLRCILSGLITEEVSNKVFGKPCGSGSSVWYRKLQQYRNRK